MTPVSTPEDEAASTPARPVVIGGRYELQGLLGTGGMGAVYRARDRELDEVVALKMLRREMVDAPGMLERFRREAKLARRVTHVNVARTFDIGEHEHEGVSDKFLTMELVDGESLAVRLARTGPMPVAAVVEIASAVCAGLGAAHEAGVVHRDLKPDNVLVAKDGRVVVTDFGIARAHFTAGPSHTQGAPVGTPAYMAPEQVEGAADVDARADLYALGAMLFELLTGERAWNGDSPYVIAAARLSAPPPDARAIRADVPDAMASLLLRLMARRREDRPASAAEVARVLAGMTLPAVAASGGNSRAKSIAPPPPSRTPPGVKTVAVLPLRNAGAEEDEYLADGLTEDLIDALSMTPGLRVRSRGAVMSHKADGLDPREVGRALGVHVVVEGSVRRAGDRLRVSVRAVGVEDGFLLWATRFDRAPNEVLEVADEAADAIAAALTVERDAPTRVSPTDPRAVDLYMRARHEYHVFWRDGVERAIELFRRGLEIAPGDPLLLSGYAMALLRRMHHDPAYGESADEAIRCAERALAVAPHLVQPRVTIASLAFNDADNVRAATILREALLMHPDAIEARELVGRTLIDVGRGDAGIPHLKAAIASDPRLRSLVWDLARAHALAGRWDEAWSILATPPEDASSLNLYWVFRWRLLLWSRDVERAKAALEALAAGPEFELKAIARVMCTVAIDGKVPEVLLEDLARRGADGRSKRRRAYFRQLKAEVLVVTGDADATIVAIEEAELAGLFDIAWLDGCPSFAPLRELPRFRTVRDRVLARARAIDVALSGRAPP